MFFCGTLPLGKPSQKKISFLTDIDKGNRAFADLRYGEEDGISPRTLIFAAIKG